MHASLPKDYFALFGLTPGFELDAEALRDIYRKLQAQAHPDRHVQASDQQRRLAVQWATFINEAYNTLRDPVARARYLLQLRGTGGHDESQTVKDPAFLMEQMELREQLDATPAAELGALIAELEAKLATLGKSFAAELARDADEAARGTVQKMQFIARLLAEAHARDEIGYG